MENKDEIMIGIDSIETQNQELIHDSKNKITMLKLELRSEVIILERLEQIQRETKQLSKLINN